MAYQCCGRASIPIWRALSYQHRLYTGYSCSISSSARVVARLDGTTCAAPKGVFRDGGAPRDDSGPARPATVKERAHGY